VLAFCVSICYTYNEGEKQSYLKKNRGILKKYTVEKKEINGEIISIHHYTFATEIDFEEWKEENNIEDDDMFFAELGYLPDKKIVYRFNVCGIDFGKYIYIDCKFNEN